MNHDTTSGIGLPATPLFATTHWTVVVNAGDEASPRHADAMVQLCRAYWYPLYAFVRRRGASAHDAQDQVQEFFAQLLEKNFLDRADRTRGKFRWFLLGSFRHFLSNERQRAQAARRGGGNTHLSWDELDAESRYAIEPASDESPESLFDRAWALTLLDRVKARVRDHYQSAGKASRYAVLQSFLPGQSARLSQSEAASELGISEGALRVELFRLRTVFKEFLRAEVAHTVATSGEIEEELRALLTALGS